MDYENGFAGQGALRRSRRYSRAEIETLARRGVCSLQDDFSVANAAGATVRADINAQLQSLATLSSGTSAPSTTYANQLWIDTTNNLAKKRNNANSSWQTFAAKDFDVWLLGDGAVGAPAYSFSGDTDCGMYRIGANNIGWAVGGVKVFEISGTTLTAHTLTVSTGTLTGVTAALTNTADTNTSTISPTHATYTGAAIRIVASRAASSAYYHFYATSNAVETFYVSGTGLGKFAGGIIVTGGIEGAGTITHDATVGLRIRGTAGGTDTVSIANSAGSDVIRIPVGTVNVVLAGALGVSALTTVTDAGNTSAFKFHSFVSNAAECGNIIRVAQTSVVTFTTTSDSTLKNIKGDADRSAATNRIMAHRMRDFEWKDSPGLVFRGPIAQEAYEVDNHPMLVHPGEGKSPWGINMSGYIPDLIMTAQHLAARLAALEARQ